MRHSPELPEGDYGLSRSCLTCRLVSNMASARASAPRGLHVASLRIAAPKQGSHVLELAYILGATYLL